MVIKRVHFTSFTLQTNSIMPFGPIKTTLAVVGASIVSYYTISPAAKAVFRKNDNKNDDDGDGAANGDGAASGVGKDDGVAIVDGGNGNDDGAASGAASGDGDGAANSDGKDDGGGGGKKQHLQRSALVKGDRGRPMHRHAYTTTVSTQVRSCSSGDRGRLTRRQADTTKASTWTPLSSATPVDAVEEYNMKTNGQDCVRTFACTPRGCQATQLWAAAFDQKHKQPHSRNRLTTVEEEQQKQVDITLIRKNR